MLSNGTILALATTVCLIPACRAADTYAAVLDRLRRIAPPPRLSPELRVRVIAALPREGEVTSLKPIERDKLASLDQVSRAHGREGEYLFKVVQSRQVRLAVHARFVILITDAALKALTVKQLQALVGHEVGHDYVWDEYHAAQKKGDWACIRELELFCDGVAMLTLARMGIEPSTLSEAIRVMDAVNRVNGLTGDLVPNSHPSVAERARFGKELTGRLNAGFNL